MLGLHCCMIFTCCQAGSKGVQASIVVARELNFPTACGVFLDPRDQTHLLCIGRQILNQWATREVQGNITFV